MTDKDWRYQNAPDDYDLIVCTTIYMDRQISS